MLLARLAALGRGQRAVAVEVEAVEACQRPFAHLLAGDEALLTEHPPAAHFGTPMAVAAKAAPGAAIRPHLAAPLAGVVIFGAAEAAVAIGVEALEHASGPLPPALLEGLMRF